MWCARKRAHKAAGRAGLTIALTVVPALGTTPGSAGPRAAVGLVLPFPGNLLRRRHGARRDAMETS
jgi:hypothetical protein